MSRFRESTRGAGILVELVAPATVVGRWDRARIDTILTNLLSNAIKYGAGKPIEVRVASDGRRAWLSVEDHGIGIAPADQARIFERFERAVPERHYGGFGLGLWIARMMAEAHGGRLGVQSKQGEGSTFLLDLPIDVPGA
jgi:signal transduction histidine kinase